MKKRYFILLSTLLLGSPTNAQNEPTQADFNRDGRVDIVDFTTFAQAFAHLKSQKTAPHQADFNHDGQTDFSDFLIFSDHFGQAAFHTTAPQILPTTPITLSLIPQPSTTLNQVTLAVAMSEAQNITAYQLTLSYDASTLQLMRAETIQSSCFTQNIENQPVALQALTNSGALILADAFVHPIIDTGPLLNLTFQIIDPEAISGIEISNVLIADAKGNINAVHGARLADLNPVPSEFALRQNHPNPFNPETQIGYQLPEPGDVSLTIYSLLGQQIRQLVNAPQAAGIYQTSWDGQDALGRSVASGLYFYHLKSGQFSQTKMMILLK
jgi:hypothetical protein